MSEQNKELIRQFWKAWDAGDTGSFGDFVATDVVDHNAMPGTAPGLEGIKQLSGMMSTAFPDMARELHIVIAEADLVAGLATARGTHTGPFMGLPVTGKGFEINTIHIFRVADGKVVEHRGMVDQASLMSQIGLMPPPPGTEGWRPPPTSPQVTGVAPGDPAAHRAVMDRELASIAANNLDGIMAGIAEDIVDHAAMPGQVPGKEGIRWRFEQTFAGLADPEFKVVASVGEGPHLSQAYTFSATHTGTMMGIPATGKSFTVSAIDFTRIENGLMREHWGLLDVPAMMIQLGLMQPPG